MRLVRASIGDVLPGFATISFELVQRMTVRETGAFALLKKHLFAPAPGEIAETGHVTALLAGCWHEFMGAESQRIHEGKLGRMEDVSWAPPVLSFRRASSGVPRESSPHPWPRAAGSGHSIARANRGR